MLKSEALMAAKNSKGSNSSVVKGLSLITQFGIYMLVPIAGLSVGGYFLDKLFGTQWIIIVCFFVGAIAGGQNVYRLAMKIAAEKQPEPERNILNRRQAAVPKDGEMTESSDAGVSSEKK